MKISQYHIVLVNLDPTVGSEIKKTRPCIIISPNEMNKILNTVIIVPITSNKKKYPTRVSIVKGDIKGMVAIDQIRTIDKKRIVEGKGRISTKTSVKIKKVISEMLVE